MGGRSWLTLHQATIDQGGDGTSPPLLGIFLDCTQAAGSSLFWEHTSQTYSQDKLAQLLTNICSQSLLQPPGSEMLDLKVSTEAQLYPVCEAQGRQL